MAKGLGKGLSVLMQQTSNLNTDTSATLDDTNRITELEISKLTSSTFQPRHFFDEDELKELAKSIEKNGVFQPILVRKIKGETPYEIIAGERRWRASQIANKTTIPAIIRELKDHQALEIAIIENVQRQDLKILEVAEGYQRLINEFDYTQDALCKIIGKSRSAIANTLRLQSLPETVKKLVNQGDLSAGHARALITSNNAETHAKQVVKKGLNVRQTEALVKKLEQANTNKIPSDPELLYLQKQLSESIGYKVNIGHHSNGGKVTLAYKNLEELDKLLARLHNI